ncbi:NEW3 domain-containing protein [Streptomyces sp. M10(2022)]
MNPGRTGDGTLTVTNTSTKRAPETRIGLSAPDGWTVTPDSARVAPLAAGADAKVPFEVTPPASAAPGTYTLDITLRHGRMTTTTKTEVKVAPENLALGRAATQQATAWDSPASLAVDGNTEGNHGTGSVTHTAEPSNQAWWQVDLGTGAALDQVELWNRTDCCADRLKDYWVLASDTPITADGLDKARTAPGVTAVHMTDQAGRPGVVALPPGTTGRYVRVQLASATDPLSLAEVEVRGARTG